jgi:hypothetical protein
MPAFNADLRSRPVAAAGLTFASLSRSESLSASTWPRGARGVGGDRERVLPTRSGPS